MTQCEFQDFPATHILREINFGHIQAWKTAFYTNFATLKFDFNGFLKAEMCQKTKIDFT